ncbi:anti-sigma factor domain-containing protein [Clostridium beijerinckii]|uniref:anti-sigma factor domain-containing protein n=1 Tax=Clostridium beijerinckii TaxID=1520 RepID=UPI000478C860|nr:anti-sigma factor domain-containing protein [Clostridium beijerinckii]
MENLGFSKDKYVFSSMPSMFLIGDTAEDIRKKQISLFINELSSYNVLLKDLVNFPIKEVDRNIALNIAYYIAGHEDLLRIINEKRVLPIVKISKLTRIKSEIINKFRDHIIAYCIIITNSNYRFIQDYLRIKLKEDNQVVGISSKNQQLYKGIVIKASKNSAYILTSKGEFLKIKTSSKSNVGDICEGKEKKGVRGYKIHISILLFILILIGSGITIEYRTTQSIIVIETTSNIKININKFNKVIYVYSPTDKGKELVGNIDVLNKDVDEAIVEIFEYALDNQMLDLSKKTLITINGQALKYGELTKTNKFIYEHNIPIAINNAGNQQKLPKYSTEDGKEEKK